MRVTKGMKVAAGVSVVLLMAAGCSSDDNSSDSGSAADKKIALLLPETQTTRYEQFDKPYFEAKVASECGAEVIYSNANQDAAKQQADAESALAAGANVMVLDPVDGAQAGAIVSQAQAKNVPVISYDRLITGAEIDLYISFDNFKVGVLQATSLVDRLTELKATGGIVMINGSPTDNNAKLFKEGAHSVIDESDFEVLKETDTKDWKPENAQADMEGNIASLGADGFVGVYAANDGTAGGAIAAMSGAGINPLPPVTGQDAELAAIQRILAGDQYMTVYKALKPEAEAAAVAACAFATGSTPEATASVNNGSIDVKSILLEPVAVTADNVESTVVADNFYTVEQICTPEYEAACKEAGLE